MNSISALLCTPLRLVAINQITSPGCSHVTVPTIHSKPLGAQCCLYNCPSQTTFFFLNLLKNGDSFGTPGRLSGEVVPSSPSILYFKAWCWFLGNQNTSILRLLQQESWVAGNSRASSSGCFPMAKQKLCRTNWGHAHKYKCGWAVGGLSHSYMTYRKTDPPPLSLSALVPLPLCFPDCCSAFTLCFAHVTLQTEMVNGFMLRRINFKVYTQKPPQYSADLQWTE